MLYILLPHHDCDPDGDAYYCRDWFEVIVLQMVA